ncbi:hypothetical protein [Ktedonobacter racemifer]|uniref:Uncharacterized protein n=1 Tax=Ktedonobacter racemifer DSM 44963 TaxID=485913 RepID=D6U290_KTERA|nr:hypothetical protein [Ktedonobacter racemifer]EFH82758.1 hypothetical protein Krac_3607 [Ktedonobacter racemifer DSM 44963]
MRSFTQEEAQGLADKASALPRIKASAEQGAKQRGKYHILVKHTRERLQTRVFTKDQLDSILEAWKQIDGGETGNATHKQKA